MLLRMLRDKVLKADSLQTGWKGEPGGNFKDTQKKKNVVLPLTGPGADLSYDRMASIKLRHTEFTHELFCQSERCS